MDTVHDDAELGLAGRLGAGMEAARLGCRLVGTEHLLMATMADPAVRWTMTGLGHDLRDVQTLVNQATVRHREPGRDGGELTAAARDLIAGIRAALPEPDADATISPAQRSEYLRAIFVWLLTHADDCAGRHILEELHVPRHAETVLKIFDERAGSPPLPGPPLPGPRLAPDDASVWNTARERGRGDAPAP